MAFKRYIHTKLTCQDLLEQAHQRGSTPLPPDHPVYSEGPSISFLRHKPATKKTKQPKPEKVHNRSEED